MAWSEAMSNDVTLRLLLTRSHTSHRPTDIGLESIGLHPGDPVPGPSRTGSLRTAPLMISYNSSGGSRGGGVGVITPPPPPL